MYLLSQPVRPTPELGSLQAPNQFAVCPPGAIICCWIPISPLEMQFSLTSDEEKNIGTKLGRERENKKT